MLPGRVTNPENVGPETNDRIDEMKLELTEEGGYIVYFRGITWRATLREMGLHEFMDLVPVFGTENGSIFQLKPEQN